MILSGGAGTRLWPLSRELSPKQFSPFFPGGKLFSQTLSRVSGRGIFKNPAAICGKPHEPEALMAFHEAGTDPALLVLEPAAKNTAAAVALAALLFEDETLMILPSDHWISDREAFNNAALAALEIADSGGIAVFGVAPRSPESGYGYIRGDGGRVAEFIEKPGKERAAELIGEGCLWNSGMFMMRAETAIAELLAHSPEILAACREAVERGRLEGKVFHPRAESFLAAPAASFDYAVMEKTSRAFVVPAEFGWSDLGSWGALWERAEKDKNGNSLSGDALAVGVSGSYVRGDGVLAVACGVKDVVVVATKDAVLVADKNCGGLKEAVALLKNRPEAATHKDVRRQWGSYEVVSEGRGFKTKKLTLAAGAAISLQRHFHRSEHWVVVAGEALVTLEEKRFPLRANESAFIPAGAMHRLENTGDSELVVIEVQTGNYLEEDDIERLKTEDKTC